MYIAFSNSCASDAASPRVWRGDIILRLGRHVVSLVFNWNHWPKCSFLGSLDVETCLWRKRYSKNHIHVLVVRLYDDGHRHRAACNGACFITRCEVDRSSRGVLKWSRLWNHTWACPPQRVDCNTSHLPFIELGCWTQNVLVTSQVPICD